MWGSLIAWLKVLLVLFHHHIPWHIGELRVANSVCCPLFEHYRHLAIWMCIKVKLWFWIVLSILNCHTDTTDMFMTTSLLWSSEFSCLDILSIWPQYKFLHHHLLLLVISIGNWHTLMVITTWHVRLILNLVIRLRSLHIPDTTTHMSLSIVTLSKVNNFLITFQMFMVS
jgi:hypothetical protein